MNFLSRIQRKSSATKTQYSFVIAGLVTGVIGLVWVSTLPARFDKFLASDPSIDDNSKGFTELLSDTKSQVGNIIDSTKEDIGKQIPATESLNALGTTGEEQGPVIEDSGITDTGVVATSSVSDPVYEPAPTSTTTELFVQPAPKMILIGTTTSAETPSTP